MTPLWSSIVIALVVLNILACLWLLIWTSKKRPEEVAEGEETGHVWDDDLREYNNPLPRWWLNLFIITVIFGIGYLILYPGLGNFGGYLGWSSTAQMQQRLAAVEQKRAAVFAPYESRDVAALAQDRQALLLGGKLFANHCAGCHGTDARGAVGFPDLTDDDWLYGGSAEQVYASITNGRRGQMPSFVGTLDEEEVRHLVAYLSTLHRGPAQAADEPGAKRFATTCAACHGADAQGNQALGAPNLADEIWLYGADPETLRQTIVHGRQGEMPAFAAQLTDTERRLLAAYVVNLSATAAEPLDMAEDVAGRVAETAQ